jgi:hypothetical protein
LNHLTKKQSRFAAYRHQNIYHNEAALPACPIHRSGSKWPKSTVLARAIIGTSADRLTILLESAYIASDGMISGNMEELL